MAAPRIHTQSTVVVLLGSFNTRIFEPMWFSRNGLVPEQEASKAEVQLIDREFCHVAFGWVDLIVTEDRLQAETTSETVNEGQIRDLLVGLLKLLPHMPVKGGSIHHRTEIAIKTEEEWHKVGHALAPKDLWQDVLDQPGMFDFAMVGVRPDDLKGAIRVRIRPSRAVRPGIFMNINDEFILSEDHEHPDVAELLEKLWPDAAARAVDIRNTTARTTSALRWPLPLQRFRHCPPLLMNWCGRRSRVGDRSASSSLPMSLPRTTPGSLRAHISCHDFFPLRTPQRQANDPRRS